MQSFLTELKHYLSTTPEEKIKEDWEKYDTKELNVGITVEQFLEAKRIFSETPEEGLRRAVIEYGSKQLERLQMERDYPYGNFDDTQITC